MNTNTKLSKGSRIQLNERQAARTGMLLLLLLLTLPAVVQAQFRYVVDNGAITITGLDYDYPLPPYPVNMNIPSTIGGLPVTSIGDWAFWDIVLTPPPYGNIIYLRDVTIPNSVTNIGNSAFYESIFLDAVTIGNGVTRIGDEAFYGCGSLNRVAFEGNAPSLGTNVFADDNNATVYYLPGTTGWGPIFGGLPTALWNLEDLFDYTTNNGAITITEYFGPSGAVTIPDTINGLPVTSIGDGAFSYSTGLSSVTMGNGITSIGAYVFLGCSNLISVTVSSRVTDIADRTFQNCIGLAHVAIPDGVTTIGAYAFSGCISLTDVTIPDSVTNISDGTFESCASLTSVTIGNSVTSIGRWAFDHCLSVTNVTMPNTVTTIGDYAFGNCTLLTKITIGDGVSRIGEYAFYECPGLANIVIPDSVTHIDVGAFLLCFNLTNVTIGNSVTTIGYDAFAGCWNLARIVIPDSVNSIEGWAFSDCHSLTSVTFMGNRVTNIPWGAFAGCSHLASILIPASVRSIGDEAFSGSTSLTNITIPDSVTSIGVSTFASCSSLTSLTIPNSVTYIGDEAFDDCTGLWGVYFKGNAPGLGGTNVFSYANNVTVYYLPGTTGWGTTFGGRPTALWIKVPTIQTAPQTQTAEAGSAVGLRVEASSPLELFYFWYLNGTNLLSYGPNWQLELTNVQFAQLGAYTVVISNVLGAITSAPALLNVIAAVERRPVPGVNVTGEAGSLLNVDYTDSLSPAPTWTLLGSVSLTNTSQYCCDPTLPLPPQRFYRAWQAGTQGVRPSLDLHLVPAITLTGTIGGSVRLDYISQFGPTDAWVTLDTVTLTNTSQLYFDISASGQPPRLYRLVPSP